MTTIDRGEGKMNYDDIQHYDQDDMSGYCSEKAESLGTPNISGSGAIVPSLNTAGGNTPPQSLDEKRMRREIANSNERRRMQSINAGFQSLRSLLPHHEGEKLSKAAILQQTAEYIYQLEQERTQLLSQNCRLKRIISKHEGDLAISNSPPSPTTSSKKRKTSDQSDDGVTSSEEYLDLKTQLERERGLRVHLEEKLQRLESLYPVAVTSIDKLEEESPSTEHITLQYNEEEILISKDEPTESVLLGPGSSPFESRPCSDSGSSPHGSDAKRTVQTSVILQPVVAHDESLLSPTVIGGHQYSAPTVLVSQSACSPTTAVKIKPKVEVERLPSTTSVALITTISATTVTTTTSNSSSVLSSNIASTEQKARVYLTSTSRQNLETIVEAIRHLEGDSLFDSASGSTSSSSFTNQEVPLALTKRNSQALLQVDMNPFLRFHTRQNTQNGNTTSVNTNTEQQQRPGVIVVKQQT